jgi:hypothetical protein
MMMTTKQDVHARLDELEALCIKKMGELDTGVDEYFDQVQQLRQKINTVRQIVDSVEEE